MQLLRAKAHFVSTAGGRISSAAPRSPSVDPPSCSERVAAARTAQNELTSPAPAPARVVQQDVETGPAISAVDQDPSQGDKHALKASAPEECCSAFASLALNVGPLSPDDGAKDIDRRRTAQRDTSPTGLKPPVVFRTWMRRRAVPLSVTPRTSRKQPSLSGRPSPPGRIARSSSPPSRLGVSTRRRNAIVDRDADQAADQLASAQLQIEDMLYQQRLREEAAERAREEERRAYRIAPDYDMFPEISPEQMEKLEKAMEAPMTRSVGSAPNGTTLTRRDLGTLIPDVERGDPANAWLNDEIINTSMQHVVQYGLERADHKRGNTPKLHSFASQFYQNLANRGPQSVSRWAKRAKIGGADLLNVDYLFVPCNPSVHWTVLVIMPTRKLVEYFDSLHGSAGHFLRLAKDWLTHELGDLFDAEEWTFRTGIGPSQRNSEDCGVFVVTTSKMVMLNIDPEKAYNQSHMPLQRQRIACEILEGGFKGEFDPTEMGYDQNGKPSEDTDSLDLSSLSLKDES